MSRIAAMWLAAAVLGTPAASKAAIGCLRPTLGVDVGGGLEAGSLGHLRPVGTAAVVGGLDLDNCIGWPIRIEAAVGSSTRGPPWWQGVAAVSVLAYTIDAGIVAGPSVAFIASDDGERALGLELLVGPHLRVIGVATRVQGAETTAVEPRALGRVAGGIFGRWGNLRVHVRVDWVFPADGNLLAGIAYLF